MSSGEVAALRLLATLASEPLPFRVDDLRSLEQEGQRLLADWMGAVHIAYARTQSQLSSADPTLRRAGYSVEM